MFQERLQRILGMILIVNIEFSSLHQQERERRSILFLLVLDQAINFERLSTLFYLEMRYTIVGMRYISVFLSDSKAPVNGQSLYIAINQGNSVRIIHPPTLKRALYAKVASALNSAEEVENPDWEKIVGIMLRAISFKEKAGKQYPRRFILSVFTSLLKEGLIQTSKELEKSMAKTVKNAKAAGEKAASRGRKSSVSKEAVIRVLKTADEARRKGTGVHAKYSKYKDGMTVAQWLTATKDIGGSVSNITTDMKRGNIKVEEPKAKAAA